MLSGGAAGYPVTAFIACRRSRCLRRGFTLLCGCCFATRFGIGAHRCPRRRARRRPDGSPDVRAFQVAAFTLGSGHRGIGGGLYAHHFSYIEAQYFSISLFDLDRAYVCSAERRRYRTVARSCRLTPLAGSFSAASAQWRYVLFAAILMP